MIGGFNFSFLAVELSKFQLIVCRYGAFCYMLVLIVSESKLLHSVERRLLYIIGSPLVTMDSGKKVHLNFYRKGAEFRKAVRSLNMGKVSKSIFSFIQIHLLQNLGKY